MCRLLKPDLRIDSVLQLDLERLRSLNIDALLLDVDCTLKAYRSETFAPGVEDWLSELRAAGIGLCLVSNGSKARIRRLAETVRLPVVCQACKPLPFGCVTALRRMGVDRRRAAMVGDQVFADVMAGRLAGLLCILVRPIHPEQEPWFTRMKRPLERFLLARMNSP